MANLPEHQPNSLLETDLVAQLLPSAIEILENDFRLSGIDLVINDSSRADVFLLRESIKKIIDSTGGPGNELIYRLLYRIDIPENKIKHALHSSENRDISSVISEMIVIRALQKAYYRIKFSEGT